MFWMCKLIGCTRTDTHKQYCYITNLKKYCYISNTPSFSNVYVFAWHKSCPHMFRMQILVSIPWTHTIDMETLLRPGYVIKNINDLERKIDTEHWFPGESASWTYRFSPPTIVFPTSVSYPDQTKHLDSRPYYYQHYWEWPEDGSSGPFQATRHSTTWALQ